MIDGTHIALLTVNEAAVLAGVRPNTVRKWITRYDLPSMMTRQGRVLVSEAAVIECEYQRRRETRGRDRVA